MQGQHCVFLSLGKAITVLEMEFVGSGIDTLAFGDACVAVLVDDEHVQQRRGGDIRLMAEFGELGFGGRVGDTDGGPVVKELAGRGMLGDGFERGAGIVVDGLVLELIHTIYSNGFHDMACLKWWLFMVACSMLIAWLQYLKPRITGMNNTV